jgi:ferredoxin
VTDETPEAGSIEIEIDREKCMGSGNCSYWAPGVFDLDEDGIAVVIGDPAGHVDRVELAAEHCPTAAITIRRA